MPMRNDAKDSNEVWKAIPGFEGYEVSDQGQVRSYRKRGHKQQFYSTPHLLKPSANQQRGGYRGVNLRHNGQTYRRRVASLVLLSFIGPRSKGMEACHSNNDSSNDRLENLRYDTPVGNARDCLSLSDTQVIEMRECRAQGAHISTIAETFGVSHGVAYDICRGACYREIGGTFTPGGQWSNLTIDNIIAMRIERADSDITLIDLGKKYGISESAVSLICRGKRYPNVKGPITVGKIVRGCVFIPDYDIHPRQTP